MGWRWLVVCALAGCIQPQLQPCGDLLCPVDSVCLPDNTCATQESIHVCAGKVDGETCSTTLFTGSCASGVCRPPVCGDHIVSGSEQCDGAVSGVDCVEYGFDTGIPTCSDRCGLDVVGSCVRFGWTRVLAQPVSRMAASNGRFLALSQDRYSLTLLEQTGAELQAKSFDKADSDNYVSSIDFKGDLAVAGQYGHIVRSDHGGPFVVEALPDLPDTNIVVTLGDDGSIYAASFEDGLKIVRQAPGTSSWTVLIDDTRAATNMTWVGDSLFVGWLDGELERWQPGGSFTHVATLPSYLEFIALRPEGGYYITTEVNGSFELVGSTLTPFGESPYDQIVPIGTAVYAGGDASHVTRRIGTSYERMEAPIFGRLLADGDDLYVYGNGVYKFTGTQFAQRSGSDAPARDVTLLANGEPAMATDFDALVIYGYDDWDYWLPNQNPLAIAGNTATDFYVAEVDDIEHYTGSATGFSSINPPSSLAPLDLLWTSSTLYAAGKAGVSARYSGGSWSLLGALPATCDIHQLGIAATGIYAVSDCGAESVIYKLAGTTWTELHRVAQPLVSISIDSADNIYATGSTGTVTRISGMWSDLAGPPGISISATNPSDIWVGGGPDELVHFDGMMWSRVRLVGAASPRVLATDRTVYICGASESVLLR